MRSAIVLSTHTMGLGVIRSLGIMGVPIIAIYHSDKQMGHVSKYVKHSLEVPDPEKSGEKFIEMLISTASRFEGSIVFPVSDETLVLTSKRKSLLEKYCTVACTEWDITKKFIIKNNTYTLANAIGVPAPKTIIPRSFEDAVKYSQLIEYPCLVKPSQSHLFHKKFGEKMMLVDNIDQLLAVFRQTSEEGIEVVFQEFIPGNDDQVVNYNSYFWNGQPMVEFAAQHIRNAPPFFGSPCVVASKEIPEVIEPGRKILHAMGFYGYSCTEFKKDPRDGVYKLIDVNGRHNLSTLLAVHCGINFPWIHYKHLVEGELPSSNGFRENIYWIDLIRDAFYSISHIKSNPSFIQFAKPYIHSRQFAILDWKDPKPFLRRIVYLIKRAFKELFNVPFQNLRDKIGGK